MKRPTPWWFCWLRIVAGLVAIDLQLPAAEPVAVAGYAISTNVLRTSRAVLDVTVEGAHRRRQPVELSGIVTLVLPSPSWFYMQDGRDGMLVIYTNASQKLEPGQRVAVKGWTYPGQFAVHVGDASVNVLESGPMPEPRRADVDRLAAGEDFGSWVRVEGRVVDVCMVASTAILEVASGDWRFSIEGNIRYWGAVPSGGRVPTEWLDARIEVDGICWSLMDSLNRPKGFTIHSPSSRFIRVIEPGSADIFARPRIPIDSLKTGWPPESGRVRITGTVTHSTDDGLLFLQDETGLARVRVLPSMGLNQQNRVQFRDRSYQVPLRPGDIVDVVGFVLKRGAYPLIFNAEYRRTGVGVPVTPHPSTGPGLLAAANENRLVSVRARLLEQQRKSWVGTVEDTLTLVSGDTRFQATLRGPTNTALPELPRNALLEISGVCVRDEGELGGPRQARLHLRSAADVLLRRNPFPWDSLPPGRILAVSVALGAIALAWITVLRRQVDQRRQAEDKARRSESNTRTLNYFATLLLERHAEEEILRDLAANCVSQLGYINCSVHLLDAERGMLVKRASQRLAEKSVKEPAAPPLAEIPLGHGLIGRVAQTARAEIVQAPQTERDASGRASGSEIAVPVVNNGEVLGVIASRHPDPGYFAKEHLGMLVSIASLCANKLVRVRAEQRLRELNQELEMRINERTAELVSANSLLRANADTLRQAEEELLRSLDHERELNQLKTRFVSMVSHELRNPLGVVMCSADILSNYLDELPEHERAEHLKAIHDSTARMAHLMEEVLLLGRADAGRIGFAPAPMDLQALCRRTAEQVGAATAWRCPIQVQIAADAANGEGDENLIVHILTNLLSNAVKYSPAGSEVRLGAVRGGDQAVLTVADRGIGIREPDQPRLYDAFFRGSNAGNTPGTGLGLVIVRRCVELHGGTISFVSRENHGTTFEVRLPLYPDHSSNPNLT